MRKITVTILAIITLLSLVNLSFSFSDEVKKEAEKFVRDLHGLGISEKTTNKLSEEATAKKVKQYLDSLSYREEVALNMVRYFYSKDDPYYNFCGYLMCVTVLRANIWEKNYSKQEILFNKLLPLLADKNNSANFRVQIAGTIDSFFSKELTEEQIAKFLDYTSEIVFDRSDDMEVRKCVVPLLIEYFQMDNTLLNNLLSILDNIEEDELLKNTILNSIHTALIRGKINSEDKDIVYSKTIHIVDNKDRYDQSVVNISFKILHFDKDKRGTDYLYSLMLKTNELEILERARYWYLNNYFVFMDKTREGEFKTKAREVLKQRISDENSAIRKYCIEEIIKELKELDKTEQKELKALFTKAKQKEKDTEIIKLLDKGLNKLREEEPQP